jgi:hypothetical protein
MSETETYDVVITAPVTQDTIFEVLMGAETPWAVHVAMDEAEGTVKVWWWEDGERHFPDYGRPMKVGDKLNIRDGYTVTLKGRTLTWKKVADGLGLIARQGIVNEEYQYAAAMGIIVDYENSDWDADTGNFALQAAVFGHLEFG